MKKIITALGNPVLNEELKKYDEYEILGPDILYQEGVLENLEKNKQIDFLILSELLPGEINLIDLITKIKEKNPKIEIIIILEEEKDYLKNRLIEKGIFNIFYNNKITVEEIIKIINKDKINSDEEIKEEIKLLKNMILNKELENKKNKKQKIISTISNNIIKKSKNKRKENIKILSITGTSGIRKNNNNFFIFK